MKRIILLFLIFACSAAHGSKLVNSGTGWIEANGLGTEESPWKLVRDVNIQDQTSPILIVPFHTTEVTTTLTAAVAKDDYVLPVADATGIVANKYLTTYNVAGGRWYQGRVLSVTDNNVTVDTPIDFEYQIGDSLSTGSVSLNVDGSVTPVHFNIRAPDPGIPLTGDITRLIFILETTTAGAWAEFGDLATLTKGIVLRKVDGTYQNIFNIKNNAEFSAVMFDYDWFEKGVPASAYGNKGRLTFGGQNKIGVVVRLEVDEDLEIIVQDDLTGLLDFKVLAEGHVVVD